MVVAEALEVLQVAATQVETALEILQAAALKL